eukprot:5538425-Amphidinium_carterae.1
MEAQPSSQVELTSSSPSAFNSATQAFGGNGALSLCAQGPPQQHHNEHTTLPPESLHGPELRATL